ncbi:hypothetical protein C8R45DRAFT_1219488 [Mycena sanguinolenta]|nr:hypothetical protein C8R45DRAFT_1219488 [Mycena sanguinolenta]
MTRMPVTTTTTTRSLTVTRVTTHPLDKNDAQGDRGLDRVIQNRGKIARSISPPIPSPTKYASALPLSLSMTAVHSSPASSAPKFPSLSPRRIPRTHPDPPLVHPPRPAMPSAHCLSKPGPSGTTDSSDSRNTRIDAPGSVFKDDGRTVLETTKSGKTAQSTTLAGDEVQEKTGCRSGDDVASTPWCTIVTATTSNQSLVPSATHVHANCCAKSLQPAYFTLPEAHNTAPLPSIPSPSWTAPPIAGTSDTDPYRRRDYLPPGEHSFQCLPAPPSPTNTRRRRAKPSSKRKRIRTDVDSDSVKPAKQKKSVVSSHTQFASISTTGGTGGAGGAGGMIGGNGGIGTGPSSRNKLGCACVYTLNGALRVVHLSPRPLSVFPVLQ